MMKHLKHRIFGFLHFQSIFVIHKNDIFAELAIDKSQIMCYYIYNNKVC